MNGFVMKTVPNRCLAANAKFQPKFKFLGQRKRTSNEQKQPKSFEALIEKLGGGGALNGTCSTNPFSFRPFRSTQWKIWDFSKHPHTPEERIPGDDTMSSDSNHIPPGQQRNGVKSTEIIPYSGNSASGELKNHRRMNSMEMLSKQVVLPPQMTTKVKGLFKGLKCISQIFDTNEKEPEMQIGFPTDVKHVAHIGWDGPSVNQPTWMNGFQQAPELASVPPSTSGETKTKKTSEGSLRGSKGSHDSQNRDLPEVPKPSRRHHNHDSLNDEQSDASKTSRRRQSGEESDAPKQPRRHSRKSSSSGLGSPTKDTDSSSVSKHTRKKKSNKSVDGGSLRSSRSKSLYSDLDVKDSEEQLPTSKPKDEEI